MANDFVLDMKNKMIKKWVKETHAAKVQTERKMRQELDKKILSMRTERFTSVLGLEFTKRIRYFIRALY